MGPAKAWWGFSWGEGGKVALTQVEKGGESTFTGMRGGEKGGGKKKKRGGVSLSLSLSVYIHLLLLLLKRRQGRRRAQQVVGVAPLPPPLSTEEREVEQLQQPVAPFSASASVSAAAAKGGYGQRERERDHRALYVPRRRKPNSKWLSLIVTILEIFICLKSWRNVSMEQFYSNKNVFHAVFSKI